jgi:hypothetical protein
VSSQLANDIVRNGEGQLINSISNL